MTVPQGRTPLNVGVERFQTESGGLMMLSIIQPGPLRPDMGFAVVVAIPGCDDPSAGLALAICTRCGSDRASITAKAAVALRRIWPDLRPITITNPAGGHA